MAKQVKKIPDGYTAVTPYLTVKGAAQAIDFYKKAFGAEEVIACRCPTARSRTPKFVSAARRSCCTTKRPIGRRSSPQTIGDTASSIMLYVNDADAVVKRAVEAGATLTMEVADQFYGDRCGNLKDPFGHKWTIATHVEDVPPDEIARRAAKMFEGKAAYVRPERRATPARRLHGV